MSADDPDTYQPPAELPKKAYVKNLGMVRVLEYHRDGYFHVLDRHDTRRLIHRDRLSFRK